MTTHDNTTITPWLSPWFLYSDLPETAKGRSVRIVYNNKVLRATVIRVGENNMIDVRANGNIYFCPNFDEKKKIYVNVRKTKI